MRRLASAEPFDQSAIPDREPPEVGGAHVVPSKEALDLSEKGCAHGGA